MKDKLGELNRIVGIRGSFLCGNDGRVLAQAMPGSIETEQVMIAARLAAQTFQAIGLSGNRANEIDLLFEDGRLLVKNLRTGILVLYCDASLNLPLVNLNVNAILKKLNIELKAREPGVMPAETNDAPPAVAPPAPIPPAQIKTPPPDSEPLTSPAEGPLSKRLKRSGSGSGNKNAAEDYKFNVPAPRLGPQAEPESDAESSDDKVASLPDEEVPVEQPVLSQGKELLPAPPDLTNQDHEARRLIQGATERHLTLRALGTIAVHWHCHRAHPWLAVPSNYRVLEFCGLTREKPALVEYLSTLGYRLNEELTKSAGNGRLVFDAPGWWFQAHIHMDSFEMNRRLDVSRYLDLEPLSLVPTLLLLARLQAQDMSDGELRELCALCVDHDLRASGLASDAIDLPFIAKLLGDDWGWYKIAEVNLARLREESASWLNPAESKQLAAWLDVAAAEMKNTHKTLRWRMAALAGESRFKPRAPGKNGQNSAST